jgi:hypothetical protein
LVSTARLTPLLSAVRAGRAETPRGAPGEGQAAHEAKGVGGSGERARFPPPRDLDPAGRRTQSPQDDASRPGAEGLGGGGPGGAEQRRGEQEIRHQLLARPRKADHENWVSGGEPRRKSP